MDYNQLVRWVDNKEAHAQEIQDIVTAYFMAQRIKPAVDHGDEKAMNEYIHKLALLHAIQIHAMKAKQGTDLGEIETLRDLSGCSVTPTSARTPAQALAFPPGS